MLRYSVETLRSWVCRTGAVVVMSEGWRCISTAEAGSIIAGPLEVGGSRLSTTVTSWFTWRDSGRGRTR